MRLRGATSLRNPVSLFVRAGRKGPRYQTIVVAPSYDSLTAALTEWVNRLDADVFLTGTDATCDALVGAIADNTHGNVIVFIGHGAEGAYLTEDKLGANGKDYENCHSELLGVVHLPVIVGTLHCYGQCCSSGRIFGTAIEARGAGNYHLGYIDDIPYPSDPEQVGALRGPFEETAMNIISQRSVGPEDRIGLYNRYVKEWTKWNYGTGADEDLAVLISMCIEEHIRLMR